MENNMNNTNNVANNNNVFLNISNHPVTRWSANQGLTALKISGASQVIDIPFPNVSPKWSSESLNKCARNLVKEIFEMILDENLKITGAMVQGEMGLVFLLVDFFSQIGIQTFHACSERNVTILPDGKKVAEFQFVQFRRYIYAHSFYGNAYEYHFIDLLEDREDPLRILYNRCVSAGLLR